jgi:hypothetical protein
MLERAYRPAERHAEQSAECEDHQEGRSSGDASAEWPPLADECTVRYLEDQIARAVGHQRTGPVAGVRRTAVHPADLEAGTAAVAGRQVEVGLQDRTEELPEQKESSQYADL